MSKSSAPDDPRAAVTKALANKVRRDFIRRLKNTTLPVSPLEFATDQPGLSLSTASYHASRLSDLGVIKCVEQIRDEGATNSFYKLGGPLADTTLQMLAAREGPA